MAENVMLALFAALALGLGALFLRLARRRGRVVLANLCLFLSLVFLALTAAEVYYRFIRDTTDSFGLTRASQVWFKRHYHFNGSGFRDSVELSARRPPGKRRVTFVGDSFTAGHGIADVEQRFANVIRHAHPEWDVNVMAANGLDTGAELDLVREGVANGLELDQVVLVYCLNDISDIVPEWQTILRRIYQIKAPAVIDHSYFLNLLYYRYRGSRDPDVANYYHFVTGAYRGPIWEQQAARLRELAEIVRQHGGELRVVIFPFLHAIGPSYAYRPIHEQLRAFWAAENVPCLDLLTIYGPLQARDLVVNRQDAHPNVAAHALAAQAIGNFVAANVKE